MPPRVMARLLAESSPDNTRWIERTTSGTAIAEVHTFATYTTVTLQADGRGSIEVRRRPAPGEPSVLLASVEWNDENAERGAHMTAQAHLAARVVVQQDAPFNMATNGGTY